MDTTNERKLVNRMANAVFEIRRDAKGKVCGGCKFFIIDACKLHKSAVTGNALRTAPNAPSCAQWKAR